MADPCLIRPIVLADAPRVAELERECFPDPWSREGIEEVISLPIGFGLVAECDGLVVGYILARWVADTAEILNLAIAPSHRRRGLATGLLRQALAGLAQNGVGEVYLEVRESNRSAQALYQAHGFRAAGMRRAYYRRPVEDALVLRRSLSGAA
jgi:ribosomal-protein-alanine N-acetyltransferase